ncbi:hypothetical protein MRX96_040028 [Rhipicephalus microplus]
MDEVRLQDVFYQHLMKQFNRNGSTINIFGKTICPNIHKAQHDLDISDRVKRLMYDYICELANTSVSTNVITIKQSGNQPAKDIKNVVVSKVKPCVPTKLQATAVEVVPEDA